MDKIDPKMAEEINEVLARFGISEDINVEIIPTVSRHHYYQCPICGVKQDTIIIMDTYRIFPQDAIYGYVRDQTWDGGSYIARFNCGHEINAEEELEVKSEEESK